jgi:proteic killer suppression protein
MIEGFRHKGLRQLYENDNRRLVAADMVERIRTILAALDSAETLEDSQPAKLSAASAQR